MTVKWFDEKYRNGEKPTLKDKCQLFSELKIPQPSERYREKIEECIKRALFELRQQYTPSRDVLAHGLIHCAAPLAGIDFNRISSYSDQYSFIVQKHMKSKNGQADVMARNYAQNNSH